MPSCPHPVFVFQLYDTTPQKKDVWEWLCTLIVIRGWFCGCNYNNNHQVRGGQTHLNGMSIYSRTTVFYLSHFIYSCRMIKRIKSKICDGVGIRTIEIIWKWTVAQTEVPNRSGDHKNAAALSSVLNDKQKEFLNAKSKNNNDKLDLWQNSIKFSWRFENDIPKWVFLAFVDHDGKEKALKSIKEPSCRNFSFPSYHFCDSCGNHNFKNGSWMKIIMRTAVW